MNMRPPLDKTSISKWRYTFFVRPPTLKKLAFILLLSAPTVMNAQAQARPAICEVRPSWSIEGGVRSAQLEPVGRFATNGQEGVTVRSFKFGDTKLVITAAIDYEFDYSTTKPKPFNIALAITVSDQEKKDIFESIDSSEASTLYGKDWNLHVTKNIPFDNRIYMFTLSCWDASRRPTPFKP